MACAGPNVPVNIRPKIDENGWSRRRANWCTCVPRIALIVGELYEGGCKSVISEEKLIKKLMVGPIGYCL